MLPTKPGLKRRLVYGEILRYRYNLIPPPPPPPPPLPPPLPPPRNGSLSLILNPEPQYQGLGLDFLRFYENSEPQYQGLGLDFLRLYENYENLYNLQDVKVGLLNKNLLNKSKVKQSEHISECSICKDTIFLDIIRELNCCHCFHINCIDTWLTENTKCPLCRNDLN